MQLTFSNIVEELKSKEPSMASDFIISHKLLEYIWWIHFSGSKFISSKDNEKVFFPITLSVLPYYLRLYEGDTTVESIIRRKLKSNKDFIATEGIFRGDFMDSLMQFVQYYYREYVFSQDEEIFESEATSIIEYNQKILFAQYETLSGTDNYIYICDRYIPTIQSMRVFLRKLYDTGGTKIVQDYLNQPYYTTNNTEIQNFVEKYFHFNSKRGYEGKIESKYQSLSLFGDGSLIINKPYTGYSRVALGKNSKLHILFKDLLKAYPQGIKASEEYSTVFGFSRSDKTPYDKKVQLWKNRVELKILGKRYSPDVGFLKVENNTISLFEIKIPD